MSDCWVITMTPHEFMEHKGHMAIMNLLAGIILCMRPANQRRHYNATASPTGWGHAQNDPCIGMWWCIYTSDNWDSIGSDHGFNASSVPSHHLKLWWLIINWTLRNILQCNFHQNMNSFFRQNIIKNVACKISVLLFSLNVLTHWGRVTHICVSKITIIGSDNGLSPGRRQAIIWTNENVLENVICEMASILSRPQRVKWLITWALYKVGTGKISTSNTQITDLFTDHKLKCLIRSDFGYLSYLFSLSFFGYFSFFFISYISNCILF